MNNGKAEPQEIEVATRTFNGTIQYQSYAMMTKDESRQEIAKLVEKYSSQAESYESADFNETAVRSEFINPFFKALGWDVDNTSGVSELYREVHQELRLSSDEDNKEGNDKKKPDYSFRLAGSNTPFFYVEAKKPSVHLNTDHHPAFQIRSYCWNSDKPIGIVTNFKEFAVYNGKAKPDIKHKPSVARIHYLTYKDYIDGEVAFPGFRDGFDFLWNTFSHEGVLKGGLDKYIKALPELKGCLSVDQDFLRLMDDWRLRLAKTIVRNNPNINEDELNFVVHRTINRIVFFRIAEDRGLEQRDAMLNATAKGNCYKNLFKLFDRADDKYNSGLFDFEKDKISKTLVIDDLTVTKVVKDLYFPNPYNFVQIPIEILGSSYEHLLGKVVRLSPSRNVHVEEKPEVRRAGGVYYTPQYVVNYIVENTVGKLIEGKTPKEVEKIKIVDPACGSGSFLLGAYHFLLDWHKDYYFANDYNNGNVKSKGLKTDKLTPDYQLTATEKKKILLNNIFGVDIDVLAVETTKLSLCIRCMQDETLVSIENTQKLFHERILPNIDGNIRDGNSLVDTNFYELDFDPADEKTIKPFHWQKHFPQVFKQGGFDVVIGNPPYIRPHRMSKELKTYLWQNYKTFVAKSDIYSCFMERGFLLCCENGFMSHIVPQTWTSLESFEKIRKLIIQNACVKILTQLPKKVFKQTTVETCIYLLQKTSPTDARQKNKINVQRLNADSEIVKVRTFSQKSIEHAHLCNFQLYGSNESQSLIAKISKFAPLSQFVDFKYGFKTGDDELFIAKTPKTKNHKPFIRSAAVGKYFYEEPREFVWYLPAKMIAHKSTSRPGDAERFENEKIIVARMGKSIVATYDEGGLYVKDAMLLTKKDLSLHYILGILNSKLINFYYKEFFITIDVLKNALLSIPVKEIDLSNKPDKQAYDTIVKLAKQLVELYNEKAEALVSPNLHRIEEKITYCEDKIDELVYQLYGLTDEEIKIVEGKDNGKAET